MRELLHIGLASSKLRQALAIVGGDEAAGRRWSNLFRESWRNARFEVRHAAFERMLEIAIKPALRVPADFGGLLNQKMLPVTVGFEGMRSIESRFRDVGLDAHGVEWGAVLRQVRQGILKHETCRALVRLGLDWKPEGPVLPEHGLAMP